MVWREVVESIARRGVSVSLDECRRSRFQSERLQPLGHLSHLESITYARDAANCVRPPNVPRSLTAVLSIAAEAPSGKNENWIPRCAPTVGVPDGVDVLLTVRRLCHAAALALVSRCPSIRSISLRRRRL